MSWLLLLACDEPPADRPPNLVLVSLDGMASFRTSLDGGPNPTTPTLERLASEGVRFESAFSQSNESLFSHASLFSGRYVSELANPSYATFTVPDEAVLVPEVLGLYGYTTAAFVAGGHVKGPYGFDQGFSEYADQHDFGAMFHTVPEALAWIETAQEPWFIVLHGYDCHRPYQKAGVFHAPFGPGPESASLSDLTGTDAVYDGHVYPDFAVERIQHATGDPIVDPEGYLRIARWSEDHDGEPIDDADLEAVRNQYDAAVLAADLQLGRFLEQLDRPNTVVVATADHGEDLHEHGLFNHRALLRDSTTKVPLVIWGAGIEPAVRTDLASAIDVVPTLLGLAGAAPLGDAPGRDLLASTDGGLVFQESVLDEVSVRSATHRLVFRGVPPAFELFDLALSVAPLEGPHFALYDLRADPREQTDVLSEQPQVAAELKAALTSWRAEMKRSTTVGSQPRDPALLEALKSRGYW
ncbi:MAG: sulfatase-like hydrolase/transferase [Proteobacteria bacterium]|nr:sulfatase-like hydrolase/transferase [Pseudomonadota bacterium]